jgi:HAD superfamily hydrolase (TIGR01549 family)
LLLCNPLLRNKAIAGLKGIIFDCDGVLFDSRDVNIKYYNMIKDALGLPPMNKEEEEYVHMHSVTESLCFIVPETLHPKISEARQLVTYKTLIPHMRMEDGLFPFLQFLKNKKVVCAVFTNRTSTMQLVLEHFNLAHYFDCVISASTVACSKPHPEGIFKILRRWNLSARDVVFIGDSELDQKAASLSGVTFWSFKNFDLQADMYISDFDTLRVFLINNLNNR